MVLMSVDLYEQTMAKLQAAVLLNEAINDPNRKKEKIELAVFIDQLKNEKKI